MKTTSRPFHLYGVMKSEHLPLLKKALLFQNIRGNIEWVESHQVIGLIGQVSLRNTLYFSQEVVRLEHALEDLYQITPFLAIDRGMKSFATRSEIVQFLYQYEEVWRNRIDDSQQLQSVSLQVMWKDMTAVLNEVAVLVPGMTSLYAKVKSRSNVDELSELGSHLDFALQQKREEVAEIWLRELMKIAVHVQVLASQKEQVCLQAVFLLKKQDIAQFREAANDLQFRYCRRVGIQISRPLPPFQWSATEEAKVKVTKKSYS